MAMVVKNNMSAVNTLNTLNKNQSALSQSLQKVSSGMKINSAG
ncbi:MAG: flagellin, partial [Selenomonas sp.]|nr:flagellin [Selenomonas sp.]